MSDYLSIIEKNRSGGVEHAATVPVFYESGPKRRLTKKRKRAKLLSSASARKGKARSDRKRSSPTRKTSPMASKKQKAAARRNIKKAQAALRAKKASRSRAAKKAARSRKAKHSPRKTRRTTRKAVKRTRRTARKAHKSSKRSRAAKKAARTRKANKAARRAAARKGARKARRSSKRRSSKKGHRRGRRRSRKTRRSMSMRIPGKSKKVYVVAAERGHRRTHRHHGGGRRRGAMENPMTGVELFVGSITGLFGFAAADVADRFLATHALTDKGTKDANGQELYADNPPADGNYQGLFNPTAICAPMDWKRWVFGLLGAAVPLGAAQLVSGPTMRSALQFFGFGYGVRVVGKGVIDGVAMLTKSTGIGQRLYDGEMRAAVLKANNGNQQANALASLPAAGLGQPKALAGCKDCGDKAATAAGAGYPSMPRETAPASTMTTATPQTPPPPPAPATPPAAFNPGPLTGVRGTNGAAAPAKKNPYAWGEDIS